jgi:hypothetical protein
MEVSRDGFDFIDEIVGDGRRTTRVVDFWITPSSRAVWWMQQLVCKDRRAIYERPVSALRLLRLLDLWSASAQ